MIGYVYLLLQIDTDGHESHKIGITKNDPELRVKQLQTFSQIDIFIIKKTHEKLYLYFNRPNF